MKGNQALEQVGTDRLFRSSVLSDGHDAQNGGADSPRTETGEA